MGGCASLTVRFLAASDLLAVEGMRNGGPPPGMVSPALGPWLFPNQERVDRSERRRLGTPTNKHREQQATRAAGCAEDLGQRRGLLPGNGSPLPALADDANALTNGAGAAAPPPPSTNGKRCAFGPYRNCEVVRGNRRNLNKRGFQNPLSFSPPKHWARRRIASRLSTIPGANGGPDLIPSQRPDAIAFGNRARRIERARTRAGGAAASRKFCKRQAPKRREGSRSDVESLLYISFYKPFLLSRF